MYDRFVELYDYIFPLKPAQPEFVLRHSQGRNRYLDVGCSTGALAASLSVEFSETVALDYSQEMVEKAKERETNVTYLQGDMRSLHDAVSGMFDVVTCFGNTLVHLSSEDEIAGFFKSVKELLSDKGVFLFQIVNYDRILREQPAGLPTIDNDHITFIRNYSYESLPHVRFATGLTDKENGATITGEVPLLAVESETVQKLLDKCGFQDVTLFGSFEDDAFGEDSFPLIVTAKV